jgi:hypothetical protein
MKMPLKAALLAVILTVSITGAYAQSACDRTCLVKIMDDYLAAMVKHDPAGLPLAAHYKYTEDTATIPIGDGLWVGASEAPTGFKIYAADPSAGQVGFFGVLKEWDNPVLLAMRLKVENGSIVEIEHVVARNLSPSAMKNLESPRAGFVTPVPPSERTSRAEMLKAADSYFESIEHVDGSLAPFADDCERHENGTRTTTNKVPDPNANPATQKLNALNCRDQMNTHNLAYIARIRPRRLLIVDEEYGLVFGFPMFVHRGDVRSIKIVNVPGVDRIPINYTPINLQAGEIFKIRAGKIHEVEANGFLLPYNAASGWN